ncbi:MAG: recombination protein RecR, partial [Clostridia bacterium]|nr:recombination protein RecR [Clostridia bacterium]
MEYIEPISRLIAEFSKLPGVGKKTAARYAFSVISMPIESAENFCDAIMQIKKSVRLCKECGNYTDQEVCEICSTRDKSVICVVKEPRDVIALEKTKSFGGVYHVLHGHLSPIEGIGVSDIRIKELLERIQAGGVKEVIIATGTDQAGEATALYIAMLVKPLGVKATRIARGLPSGSNLEYTD